jgi:sugar lactone lactonase YvrE
MKSISRLWVIYALLALTCILLTVSPQVFSQQAQSALSAATDLIIYDDSLALGWVDASSGSTTDPGATDPVYSGAASYAVTITDPLGGLRLQADPPISTTGYTHLRFLIHGGAAGDQSVTLKINDNEVNTYAIQAPVDSWVQIEALLRDLGNPATISNIFWQDATDGAQPTFYLDDIALVTEDIGNVTFPDPIADHQRSFSNGPSGVAIAPDGRVYVAVYQDNRIYSWPSTTVMTGAAPPDLTFGIDNGNPDEGCTHGPSATIFCGPESVAVDAAGNLYVGDTYHHRILIFLNPETNASPLAADAVLGQPNLLSGVPNYDSNAGDSIVEGFCYVRGVAVDELNRVYAADEWNHRVLVFDDPLTTDALPDRVLGRQTRDEGINTQCTTTFPAGGNAFNRFYTPLGVAVDAGGNLFVADTFNSRVLRFDNGFLSAADASEAYTNLNFPHDVAIDNDGNLYVADTRNNRVHVFANAATGDPFFDHEFTGLNYPMGMAFDAAGSFAVANCGAHSAEAPDDYPPCLLDPRNVLIFDAPGVIPPTPTHTPTPTATNPGGGGGDTPTPTATEPVDADVIVNVDLNQARKPISPYIYGLNFATESFANELNLPLRRWGGNLTTRYNWQTGNTNHGSDWFFHNNAAFDPYTGAAQTAEQWIAENQSTGAKSLLTLPMIGFVAKDGNPASCGFAVSRYGAQDAVDTAAGFPDCGNGLKAGQPITSANPADTSITVDANFVANWVAQLKSNGAVQFYALDNEPDLWFETHRDVYPTAWTYDQFRDLSVQYAAAIKSADPNAKLFGPVVHGWTYYIHSPRDGQLGLWATHPDRAAHGDQWLVEWYLEQMAAYEQQHGVRLLDYFDLHYYPAVDDGAPQIALALTGDAALQSQRLASTRSLWDPTYTDDSWISDVDGPTQIQLIPRMRQWVADHYPGTKLAISEYNWGGLETVNGALAQAEVLGVFGREGVDVAALWNYPDANSPLGYTEFDTLPGANAFRIYRNYDGQGASFGEMSVQATSSDPSKLSVFAAVRSSDNVLTLVIINKSNDPLSTHLSIAGLPLTRRSAAASAQVYRYSGANPGAIQSLPDQPVNGGAFATTYPPNSITLVQVGLDSTTATSTTTPATPTTPTTGTPTATPTGSRTPTPTGSRTPTPTPTGTQVAGSQRELYLPIIGNQ